MSIECRLGDGKDGKLVFHVDTSGTHAPRTQRDGRNFGLHESSFVVIRTVTAQLPISPTDSHPILLSVSNSLTIMAAQQAADAVKDTLQNVTEKVHQMSTSDSAQPNLLLDEETGEHVSKTELKKRQKQREKEAKKAEREATRQAPPQPKRKAASQEEEEGKLNANVSHLALSSPTSSAGDCPRTYQLTGAASNTSRSARAPSSA